jgi:hypothetical protein
LLTTDDASSLSFAQVMMMWLSVSTSNNGMAISFQVKLARQDKAVLLP